MTTRVQQISTATHMAVKSEVKDIRPNSLYLTFNAPQVDEYHRGIFLSTKESTVTDPNCSGILFHAAYTSPTSLSPSCLSTTISNSSSLEPTVAGSARINGKAPDYPSCVAERSTESLSPALPPTWLLEQRAVKDVVASKTLVLFYRIATLKNSGAPIGKQVEQIIKILQSVPLGRESRERELGIMRDDEGNMALDGYDCITWTVDALSALESTGIINLKGKAANEVMAMARAIAGPADAKSMVGVDFGGLKVINDSVEDQECFIAPQCHYDNSVGSWKSRSV